MNPRTIAVVGLAGVFGLSAMFLVQALRRPSGGPPVDMAEVVFAAANIQPGESISEAMLEVRRVPAAGVPEDAVRKVADAVDRTATATLDQGDLLRGRKLAEKGAGRGMAALVRPGMRAFTIQTPTLSSSMAGFILPGYRVDVLMTMSTRGDADDPSGGASTTTLLQNVEILAVHTTVSTPTANKINPDDARSVTLLVTPEQAGLLDLGQNKGTLHLSLRNLKDPDGPKSRTLTMADLGGVRAAPVIAQLPAPAPTSSTAPEPEPEPVRIELTVRTLRGTAAGADVLTILRPGARPRVARAGPTGR